MNDLPPPANLEPSLIVRLVGLCVARAWLVGAAIIFCALTTHYVARHFAMTTDTYTLLSPTLPWRVRRTAFNAAFPHGGSDVVVVVDGQTPELSEDAAAKLTASLSAQPKLFHAVQRPDGGPFWTHKPLLFASIKDVKTIDAQLIKAQPFLGSMAFDPSLRGLADTLSLTLRGVHSGQAPSQSIDTSMRTLADSLDELIEGRSSFFSWRT